MDYTKVSLKEKACLVGALAGSVLASVGAFQVVEKLIGHRFGDMPELAAIFTLLGMLALSVKAMAEISRERLERLREAANDWLRRINNSN